MKRFRQNQVVWVKILRVDYNNSSAWESVWVPGLYMMRHGNGATTFPHEVTVLSTSQVHFFNDTNIMAEDDYVAAELAL